MAHPCEPAGGSGERTEAHREGTREAGARQPHRDGQGYNAAN